MHRYTHRSSLFLLALLFLAACQFIPALPPPDPGPTATPLVTEGIAGSTALAYNLGTVPISQSWSADYPEIPVPLIGAIAVPEGRGPFPVALVLHGRHLRCYTDDAQLEEVWPCPIGGEPRYDIGFTYLLEALAAANYLALAPSLNGAYTSQYGLDQGSLDEIQPLIDDRMTQIIDAHLTRLAAAGEGEPVFAGGLDVRGKVDQSTVVTVAHSTSGVTANHIAREGLLPVRAQLLLTPMHFEGTGATADVPTVVLLAACDGDRPDLPGQLYYETARATGRTTPVFSTLLAGANHNYFNQFIERQGIDDGQFARNPTCALARTTAAEQQAFVAALATDLFDSALDREADPAWLDITQPAPSALYGQGVQSALSPPANQRRSLLTGRPEVVGPLEASLCAAGEPCAPGLFQPGRPDSVRLSWDGEGAEFRITIPDAGNDYDAVRLRVAPDPTDPRNDPRSTVRFSVELTDVAGDSAAVPLPQALTFPVEGTYEGDDFRFSPAMAADIRLPLTEFTVVGPAALAAAVLRFDETPTGSVLLVDWELVRGPR